MEARTTTDKPIKKRRRADGRAPTSEEETRPTRAAPEEEEVEEFFAILRRIHVAIKYFENSGAEAGRLPSGKRWRPSFQKEDFVEIHGGGANDEVAVVDSDGGNYKEVEEEGAGSEVEGAGLDLNSDPPPTSDQTS